MSDAAIKVEGLGKKYLIRHQQGQGYKALRDVLADRVKSLFRLGRNGRMPTDMVREEFWALRDVSFEVKPGEAVGVIGRNGAGKSTLLKLLSRITEPSEGRMELEGRVSSLLEVGTGFHPELTGRENIFLNGAILGMTRNEIKAKFDEMVAFAEIEKFLDTPVKRYSSGMYMRLAFAVAAHLEPEILVVDEVLAVGDASFQRKCLGKMEDVSKGGRTVLFVSHNMDAVLRLCSRALWLESGRLRETGIPTQIINRYLQQRQVQGASVDLTHHQRPGYLRGQARFASVVGGARDEGAAWSYPFGTGPKFDCFVSVEREFSQLSVAYAVFTASGFEIASARNALSTTAARILPGRYRVVIELLGCRLAPGSYVLNLGLRSENGEEDLVSGATWFDVATNEEAAIQFADSIRAATIPETRTSVFSAD